MRRAEMNRLKEVFGHEKPIIALLHVRALPGDPQYLPGDTMEQVVESARADLIALQNGGVDAVLFSNEYSLPYQTHVDIVTVTALARVISELREDIKVPFGVHVVSDPSATIELAAAVGAGFVRSVFTGAYAGEAGLRDCDIAKILRRRNALGLRELLMFYMINAESDADLSGRSLADIARAVIFKCAPDGLCVSGKSAGVDTDSEILMQVRKAANGVPVICNTGTKLENVTEKLTISDGAFVGTYFKKDGRFENMVDEERVRQFMYRVNEFRKN
jgi:membrane complex biogenesis BtpA family protein